MLSIAQMSGAGQGDYYLKLANGDYYLKGGEPEGVWEGKGAEQLGLSGKVKTDELKNLLQGYSVDSSSNSSSVGSRALVQNAGKENRQSGWDLTFSAPKSVSTAWSQSEGTQRKAFQDAHKEAVKSALSYIENDSILTRRGKGGRYKEPANVAIATFEHGTSRAGDPSLHTHALIINVGIRADGNTGSLESRRIYQHKMAAGAVYRAELAKRIEEKLGIVAEKKRTWFELKGVDKGLREEFSKRRKQVEKELEKTGNSGAVASKIATLNTREVKKHVARQELFKDWKKVGKEHGWGKDELAKITNQEPIKRNIKVEKAEAFSSSIEKITAHQSHFSRRDLIRNVAEQAQGRGLGAKEIFSTVDENLANNKEIIELGRLEKGAKKDNELRYTTKEMLELEGSMLKKVKNSKNKSSISVSNSSINKAFKNRKSISEEQKNAVIHITQGAGSVKAVSGMAGTGKSYMLGAVKEAYELEGKKVIGAALSGKAAQGLEQGSGIKSDTIHKTLFDIDKGNLCLNSSTVLVVDEAGMVGTRQMEKLVTHTQKAGAKLVLVGDARQLQPVDAGGAFKAISSEIGEVRLSEIRRQDEAWARGVVHKFANGNAKEGLAEFAKRGQLHVLDNQKEAKENLIKNWKDSGGVTKPSEHLILVGTNLEARDLNEKAQMARFSAKELSEDSISIGAGQRGFSGDRVLFTKNSRALGLRNGQLGTIERVDTATNRLKAKLDNGKSVNISLSEYEHIKLGYAVTTHKSQGMTAKNTYILVGGAMQDKEMSYVQVSRAKGKTQIFTDKTEAGENLTALLRKMGKSRQKDLASDLLEKGDLLAINKAMHIQR